MERVLSLLSTSWRLPIYIKKSLTHTHLKYVQFGLYVRVKLVLQVTQANTCFVHLNRKDFQPD